MGAATSYVPTDRLSHDVILTTYLMLLSSANQSMSKEHQALLTQLRKVRRQLVKAVQGDKMEATKKFAALWRKQQTLKTRLLRMVEEAGGAGVGKMKTDGSSPTLLCGPDKHGGTSFFPTRRKCGNANVRTRGQGARLGKGQF